MSDVTWGMACGLATGITWGAISILARSLSGTFTVGGITAIRSTVAGSIVLALTILSGHGGELMQIPLWIVLSLWASIILAMGIGDTLFFASMEHLGVTRALILSMVNPLLTTLVGMGLMGEPVTLPRAAGLFLVMGGLVLIIAGKEEGKAERQATRRGLRLVLAAAGAWALSTVMMKPGVEAVSVVAATALRVPMGGILLWLTPWSRGTVRAFTESTPAVRGRLGALCIISAVGSLLYVAGIKFGGVAIGNVLASTSPLFTLPFEVWVLGVRPTRETVLGAVTTVAGVGLLNL